MIRAEIMKALIMRLGKLDKRSEVLIKRTAGRLWSLRGVVKVWNSH